MAFPERQRLVSKQSKASVKQRPSFLPSHCVAANSLNFEAKTTFHLEKKNRIETNEKKNPSNKRNGNGFEVFSFHSNDDY